MVLLSVRTNWFLLAFKPWYFALHWVQLVAALDKVALEGRFLLRGPQVWFGARVAEAGLLGRWFCGAFARANELLWALWGLLRGANLVLLDGWLRGRIHKDLSLFMVGGAANRWPYEVWLDNASILLLGVDFVTLREVVLTCIFELNLFALWVTSQDLLFGRIR